MASKRSSGARSGGGRKQTTRTSRTVAENTAKTSDTAHGDLTDPAKAGAYDAEAVAAAGERAKAYAEARAIDPEDIEPSDDGVVPAAAAQDAASPDEDAASPDEPEATDAADTSQKTWAAPRAAGAPRVAASRDATQEPSRETAVAAQAQPAKSSGGFMSGLLGAVIGAGAAAGALVFVAPGLLAPPAGPDVAGDVAEIRAASAQNAERIQDLDAEIDARVAAIGQTLVDPAPMVNELADAIEAEMLVARDQRFALNERLQAAGERLNAVEQSARETGRALEAEIARLAAAPAAPAAVGDAPAPAAADDAGQLAALQAASTRLNALEADLAALGERLAATETVMQDAGAAPEAPALSVEQIASTATEAAQQAAQEAAQEAAQSAIAPASARIDEIETSLAASVGRLDDALAARTAEAAAAQAAAAQSAEAVEARIAALEASANTPLADAAVGVALSAVSQAVATTAPYAVELDILRASAGLEIPAPLSAAAEDGLPSTVALATGFVDASRAGLAAAAKLSADQAAQEGDYLSALGGRLSQIIVVRRTEGVAGDTPTAVVSRAQALLDGGDVRGALSEIETLPVEVQIPMADWIERARLRADAEAALADVRATLLTGGN